LTTDLILLCFFAFFAGFVDSIVGGGGLIQTPAALVLLPQYAVANVIGTLKIPAFTGTSFAAVQYTRKVEMQWKSFFWITFISFLSSMAGSAVLSRVNNNFMKPLILCILVLVAAYTYRKKDFGTHVLKLHSAKETLTYGSMIGLIVGFYDGFIGPGAGSFLIVAFISILGFDFLKASAHAKLVNLATNLGSILFFASRGMILYEIALPMALFNGLGGLTGARWAILKGNRYIRVFFLVVMACTILRFAYDIFKHLM
jgi:uncharacterized membrane protein YfcA